MNAGTRSVALPRVSPRLAGLPVWISIGNNDNRVRMYAMPGHLGLPARHDSAAEWVVTQMGRKE